MRVRGIALPNLVEWGRLAYAAKSLARRANISQCLVA